MQSDGLKILVLGASYGLLPGIKLALAGHKVTFVGRREELEAMSASGLSVAIPLRRSDERANLCVTPGLEAEPGHPALRIPQDVDPATADFILLAMQEPHFAAPEVAALLRQIGEARRPCLSIMNLPPPPFLARLGITSPEALRGVFTSEDAWETIDPGLMALASPDPQAVRINPERPGELTVTLASNFKASNFGDSSAQRLLESLARDFSRVQLQTGERKIRLPVALVTHRSIFIPLAKWPMVLTGNFRCLTDGVMRTISEAVFDDVRESREIYNFVYSLALDLGATENDLVGFDAYARAAASLTRPSSVARALSAGAVAVERLDKLIDNLSKLIGRENDVVSRIVETVERRLSENRK